MALPFRAGSTALGRFSSGIKIRYSLLYFNLYPSNINYTNITVKILCPHHTTQIPCSINYIDTHNYNTLGPICI